MGGEGLKQQEQGQISNQFINWGSRKVKKGDKPGKLND